MNFYSLKKLGISLKKAQYFITCKGKYFTNSYNINLNFIETNLISLERSSFTTNFKQLSIFDNLLPTKEDRIKCLTGNI